ncbi:MAG: transporter substrate-binding domain-containing protein [Alphaproteobacteria bacterium]|nr:transporter substrate-binding domain-containing protein [Alphaproteobacteria bacterium]
MARDTSSPDRLYGRQPVVYGTVWGHTLEQDGSGFYNELFSALTSEGLNGQVDYKPMPYRRARTQFKASRSACLYPSALSVLKAGGDDQPGLLESQSLFQAQEHIFTRPDSQPPRSLADLRGKTVAIPTGSIMAKILKGSGARLITVHDETAKAQMLMTGRVDMMAGMLPNEHLIFASLGTHMAAYDEDFTLLEAGIGVVCHDTPENRSFIRTLDDRIKSLQQTSAFREKLSEAGIMETSGIEASLNGITPAAGPRLRFVHPGRRSPFSNIR